MPSTTRGFPYPDSTGHTRLWEHLQNLAQKIEDLLPRSASGEVSVTTVTNPDTVTVSIVFPAGRFSSAPKMAGSVRTTLPNNFAISFSSITTSGCDVTVYRSGAAATFAVQWIAQQAG